MATNYNLELAEKCPNLMKRMFKAFTGQEVSFAQEILEIEAQIKALQKTSGSPDTQTPPEPQNTVKKPDPPQPVKTPVKAAEPPKKNILDEDLPF